MYFAIRKCYLGLFIFISLSNYIIQNTFASQRLVLEEKNEPFLLENALNLTQKFLNDNFNKKILLNFCVKIAILKLMY